MSVYVMKNHVAACEETNNCTNVLFCGNQSDNEYCEDCNVMFAEKKLNVITDVNPEWNCPVCFESPNVSVQLFNCNHQLCMTCFKQLYIRVFSDKELFEQGLQFPYPGIANDYLQRPDNGEEDEKWANDYPLIANWKRQFMDYINFESTKFIHSKMHRRCPLCENPKN